MGRSKMGSKKGEQHGEHAEKTKKWICGGESTILFMKKGERERERYPHMSTKTIVFVAPHFAPPSILRLHKNPWTLTFHLQSGNCFWTVANVSFCM